MKPEHVTSPRDKLEAGSLEVIFTSKDRKWSLAEMIYKNNPAVGIRWNGDSDDSLGNPTSHGQATWFILPKAIGGPIAELITNLKKEVE